MQLTFTEEQTALRDALERLVGDAARAKSSEDALWRALVGQVPAGSMTGPTMPAGDQPVQFDTAQGHRIPPRIRETLLRGLERAPERRFASMHELLARLAPPPPRTVRWGVAVAAAALVAAAAVSVSGRALLGRCAIATPRRFVAWRTHFGIW